MEQVKKPFFTPEHIIWLSIMLVAISYVGYCEYKDHSRYYLEMEQKEKYSEKEEIRKRKEEKKLEIKSKEEEKEKKKAMAVFNKAVKFCKEFFKGEKGKSYYFKKNSFEICVENRLIEEKGYIQIHKNKQRRFRNNLLFKGK